MFTDLGSDPPNLPPHRPDLRFPSGVCLGQERGPGSESVSFQVFQIQYAPRDGITSPPPFTQLVDSPELATTLKPVPQPSVSFVRLPLTFQVPV